MNDLKPVIIETERLTLRPFCVDDAQAMFDNWASDPAVTRFLTWPPHKSVDVTRDVISSWVARESAEWCIVPKEYGEAMGSMGVVNVDGDTVEVGYCLSQKCWGRGYAAEALRATIQALFAMGAKRVTAKHDVNNPNSGRVMQKAGMIWLENRRAVVSPVLGERDLVVYHIDNGI